MSYLKLWGPDVRLSECEASHGEPILNVTKTPGGAGERRVIKHSGPIFFSEMHVRNQWDNQISHPFDPVLPPNGSGKDSDFRAFGFRDWREGLGTCTFLILGRGNSTQRGKAISPRS